MELTRKERTQLRRDNEMKILWELLDNTYKKETENIQNQGFTKTAKDCFMVAIGECNKYLNSRIKQRPQNKSFYTSIGFEFGQQISKMLERFAEETKVNQRVEVGR